MNKEMLGDLIAVIIIISLVSYCIFVIITFARLYNNYEVQGEAFTIECDSLIYDVGKGSYICSNDIYTVDFYHGELLNLTKKYSIEVYYVKTHWFNLLLNWNSSPKERQVRKLVISE